jgi:hypothetical protein
MALSGVDYATISQAQHRMEMKLREDAPLATMLKRIVKYLPMSDAAP